MLRKAMFVVCLVLIVGTFQAGACQESRDRVAVENLFSRDVLGYVGISDVQDGVAKWNKMLTRWFGEDEGK